MLFGKSIHRVRVWIFIGIVQLAVRLLGYSRHDHGKAVFWGPRHFIEYAKDALRILAEKDRVKWERISQIRWTFWYAKSQGQVANTFAIHERWCAWRAEGILTYLIIVDAKYVALDESLFGSPYTPEQIRQLSHAFSGAYDWMKLNALPNELCDAVRARAETGSA